MSEPSTDDVLGVLRASHDRLAAAFDELGEEGATRQSYDDDWSVAQVASHLGSGTEIFRHYLDAGAQGGPPPGDEINQPIWDAWNAKSPARPDPGLRWRRTRRSSSRSRRLSADQRAAFGARDLRDAAGPAGLPADAAQRARPAHLGRHRRASTRARPCPTTRPRWSPTSSWMIAGWAGKPAPEQSSVEVRTTSPERAYRLDLGPSGVSLSPSLDDTAAAGAVAAHRGVRATRLRPARPRPHAVLHLGLRSRPRPPPPGLPWPVR